MWLVALGVSTAWGVGSSLVTHRDSLSRYLVRVIAIGLLWAALITVLAMAMVSVGLLLGQAIIRRRLARLYPAGTEIEVELGEDAVTIQRPAGTTVVPFAAIRRVVVGPNLVQLTRRGQVVHETLPRRLFPEEGIATLRARWRSGSGRLLAAPQEGTHRFVTPPGWATHVGPVHASQVLRRRGFWVRVVVALAVSALLATLATDLWLLLTPFLAAVALTSTCVQTRRAIGTAWPTGSTVTSEFHDDRFVTRGPTGEREIRYDDLESVRVRGDVVALTLRSRRGVALLIARALVPDDRLEALLTIGHRSG